jgi:hypothetical protein
MPMLLVTISFATVASASGGAKRSVVRTITADVTIDKNDVKRTIDCAGGSVTVEGNGCVLVLKGDCSTLKVNGNNNTVTVEAVAEISTQGNRNKVTWTRGAGGRPPKISNPGTGNTIKRAEK